MSGYFASPGDPLVLESVRRKAVAASAVYYSFSQRPYLQLISDPSSCAKNRMRGKLKHAGRFETNLRDAEWADVFFDVNNLLACIEKDQVNRE